MINYFEKFSDQKILVTGGSGFIGPHLCRALCAANAEVHTVSRRAISTNEARLHGWQGDLSDTATAKNLLEKIRPDIIFHMAGYAVGGRDLQLVLPTFKSNLVTTVNLLAAATEIGCCRIVVAGSMEEPTNNSQEVVPSSPYAAGKWASSAYARMFNSLYQTPIVIARIFMTYGPGEPNQNKIVPYVIGSLLRGESPRLASGMREVDWVYVDDVVNGLMCAAQAPNAEGSTIDLGTGMLVSIRNLIEKLFRIVGSQSEPLFGTLPDRPMEQVRMANTNATLSKIGWKPKISLERGLRNTVDWHREQLKRAEAEKSAVKQKIVYKQREQV